MKIAKQFFDINNKLLCSIVNMDGVWFVCGAKNITEGSVYYNNKLLKRGLGGRPTCHIIENKSLIRWLFDSSTGVYKEATINIIDDSSIEIYE